MSGVQQAREQTGRGEVREIGRGVDQHSSSTLKAAVGRSLGFSLRNTKGKTFRFM